jgi:hypothetical protein
MRLIQGNKIFTEWWNNWMSRLHSASKSSATCQTGPDSELHQKGQGSVVALPPASYQVERQ